MFEIIITICWLLLLPNGDIVCRCEGQTLPAITKLAKRQPPRPRPDSFNGRDSKGRRAE